MDREGARKRERGRKREEARARETTLQLLISMHHLDPRTGFSDRFSFRGLHGGSLSGCYLQPPRLRRLGHLRGAREVAAGRRTRRNSVYRIINTIGKTRSKVNITANDIISNSIYAEFSLTHRFEMLIK